MRSTCACESRENQRLFTGAKEAKFPKENQSPLGLYRNPLTFFFTNPRFVLLIHDWHFVLFCFLSIELPCSSLITGAWATPASYVIRRNGFRLWRIAEVRKWCLYRFKYGYFSYKNAWIRYRRPLFSSRSHVRRVLIWMDALYLTTFGLLKKKTPAHAIIKIGRARKMFYITPIGFLWKKKVI